MLSEKVTTKKLDESDQKRLQKIFVKYLYYTKAIDPTMLMALKPLAAVQTKSTIETAKQITHFLNYSTAHPDEVTEYKIIRMILHIYLYEFYISEPEAQSREGGHFY